MSEPLNEATLLQGVACLCRQNEHFSEIVEAYGPPPLWSRDEGFATLIRIILEQQVSLQSAKAAFDKLANTLGQITPQSFLLLTEEKLKQIGFSRQKSGYGRALAGEIVTGTLDLQSLNRLGDAEVKETLTRVRGIGAWTANIYLLMALKRPDVWPSGDLALELAALKLFSLEKRPSSKELQKMSRQWAPWRAVAARLLYHYYLSEKHSKVKP